MASGDLVYRVYLPEQTLTTAQKTALGSLLSALFEGPLGRVDAVTFRRDGNDVLCSIAARRASSAAALPLGVEVMDREA